MMGASGGGLVVGLVLWTAVIPAGACLALWLLSRRFRAAGWRLPLAWAVAYLAAHFGIAGMPSLPPTNSTQGLVFVVLAAALTGAVGAHMPPGRVPLSLATLAVLLWLTLRPMIRYHWSALEAVLWLAGLALAIATFAVALPHVVAAAAPGRREAWVWLLAFGGMAAGLGLSSTALLAQLAAVCAVLSLVAGVAAWSGGEEGPASVRPVLVSSLWVFSLGGAFYADLGLWRGTLLALGPLGAALGLAVGGGALSQRRRLAAALVGVLLLQAPALVSAGLDFQSRASDDYGYGYGG